MAPLSERDTHTGEGWNTFTPGRLISYTSFLSSFIFYSMSAADEGRQSTLLLLATRCSLACGVLMAAVAAEILFQCTRVCSSNGHTRRWTADVTELAMHTHTEAGMAGGATP